MLLTKTFGRVQIVIIGITLMIGLFYCCGAKAQGTISGKVINENNHPVAGANILLIRSGDSSLVKGLVTNPSGKYSFENIKAGTYFIRCTFTGFELISTQAFELSPDKRNFFVPTFQLSKKHLQLEQVTVVVKKPLFEQKIDRMVINVANSITSAGSTALEVLERSPGIIVDRQNNTISMNGKNGIVIMINDKISHMPLSAVVQLLSGMNSDNIEKIELITTPPASLDAEGNAGYINIVLKSNNNFGTNGSYSITGGYTNGFTGNAGINFNHRKGKINLYGDYTLSDKHSYQLFEFYHKINYQNIVTEHNSASHRNYERLTQNVRLGLDYQATKNTVFGALVSGYNNRWTMDAHNDGTILINGKPDSLLDITNREKNLWTNFSGNVNMQHSFSDSERISLNADYIYYRDNNPVTYVNDYLDGNGQFIRSEEVKSSKITPIHFWVGAVDYSKKLSCKLEMEAGVKGTLSRFNNDVHVDRLMADHWDRDSSFSANYALKESILAAYTSFSWAVSPKTNMKLGLRYEYTRSNLGSETQRNIVNKHYGEWFPSYFISHTINDDNSWAVSYSRRITRPTFNDMAPFVIFIDPYTFFSGNPGLKPAISNNANASYTYKRKIISVSYSYESNTITNFAPNIDSVTNIETLAADNQKSNKVWAASLSVPITVNDWWNMQYNIAGNRKVLSGTLSGSPLQLRQNYLQFSSQQTFTLPGGYSLQLSGFYSTKSIFSVYTIPGFGSLDIGAQKKLPKINSSLRFNAGNILNSLTFKPSVNFPEQNLVARGRLHFSYPTFTITYTHKFGNAKVKGARSRSTGAEEETERVQ